jgi:hypothetical protein
MWHVGGQSRTYTVTIDATVPRLRPADVFTPNRFPVEDHHAYAARAEADAALVRALDRSQTPLIYGEFGVGKTTLVKRFFRHEDTDGRFIHFLSPAGKSLDELAKVILEKLDYAVEVSGESTTVRSTEGGAEVGLFSALRARLNLRADQGETRRRELVVTTPTDQGLLEVMAEDQIILAVDEMHKADDSFRAQLAEMIKAASNLGLAYPKILVLGTTLDASRLVAHDPGIDRLIAEVRVRPMTDDEATTVVRSGMTRLTIPIDNDHVHRIVRTAAGAPALVQEVCLDVAERADSETRPVVDSDIDEAIKLFLLNSQARLTAKYMAAIETTGPHRYRKQILRAMAEAPADFVTMEELLASVCEHIREARSPDLSGPLRQLKQPEYGSILMDVERPAGEGRVHNLTAFDDPRMKAFIRAMNAVEDQGLLPTEEEVATLPSSSVRRVAAPEVWLTTAA